MIHLTYEQVMEMAQATGLPFAYDHFAEGESPDPPFLLFLFPRSDNFSADGRVYHKINRLHFELYTDLKRPDIEAQVEAVLDSHDLFYEKSETWIPEEKLYEVLYEMEVIQNEQQN